MKKKYFFAALVAAFFISSCSVKYFVPYPTSQALPKKEFSIAAGIGLPYNMELQKKLTNQLDLQFGLSYLNVISSYIDPAEQYRSFEYSSAIYSGLGTWILNRDKSTLNFGLGFGGEAIKSNITLQYGGRLTLYFGGFWERYVLNMYLMGSLGGSSNKGRYIYMGTGMQTSYRIEKLRIGLRFGIIAGVGSSKNDLLVAYPIEMGFVFGYEL